MDIFITLYVQSIHCAYSTSLLLRPQRLRLSSSDDSPHLQPIHHIQTLTSTMHQSAEDKVDQARALIFQRVCHRQTPRSRPPKVRLYSYNRSYSHSNPSLVISTSTTSIISFTPLVDKSPHPVHTSPRFKPNLRTSPLQVFIPRPNY